MNSEPLDAIPIWGILLLAIFFGLLIVEGGFRYGILRRTRAIDEKEAPVAAMVAAILGLLAFMLAFTFSLAASRFDARRTAVLDEANAIGTTYLRTRLLPEPQRSDSARLLREYTDLRASLSNPSQLKELLAHSEKLHAQLWDNAVAAAEKRPDSITIGLFLQSLNETIDLHSKRVFVGIRSRIPFTIWVALFGLTILGLASVGYQAGLAGTRRSPEMPILTVAFAAVLFLIVDLDRGHEGLLRVNQQAITDLQQMMHTSPH